MKRLLTLVASVALGVASAFADAPTWTFVSDDTPVASNQQAGKVISSDGWEFTAHKYVAGNYNGYYKLDVCEEGEGTLDLTNLSVREIASACFTNHRTVTRLVGAEKLALINTAFQNDTTLSGEVRLPAMTSVPANAFNTQSVLSLTPRKITDFYLPKATTLNGYAFRTQTALKTIVAPNAKFGTSNPYYILAQLSELEYAELGTIASFPNNTFYNTMTTSRKVFISFGGAAPTKYEANGWANNFSSKVENRTAPFVFVARDYAANTASWNALVVATAENPGDYADMFAADYKFADYRPPAEHLVGLAAHGTGYAWIVKTPVHYVFVRDANGEIANRYYFYHGENVELATPQAPDGMKLVNWVGTRTVESNLDIQPEFEEDLSGATFYALTIPTVAHATAEVTVNGKVVDDLSAGVREGATVVVTWTAEAGYKITAGGEETIQMTEAKEAMAPTVEAIPVYALTIPSVEHASAVVTVNDVATEAREFLEGTTVVVTWTAEAGYKITAGGEETIQITEAKAAKSPTVEVKGVLKLTIPTVANATAVVTVGGKATEDREFAEGTMVVVTWTPASNYVIQAGATETIEMTEDKTAATPSVVAKKPNVSIPTGVDSIRVAATSISGATRYEVVVEGTDTVVSRQASAYLPLPQDGQKIARYTINVLDSADAVLRTYTGVAYIHKEATETLEKVWVPCFMTPINTSNGSVANLIESSFFKDGDILQTVYATNVSKGQGYQQWVRGSGWMSGVIVKTDGSTYTSVGSGTKAAVLGSAFWAIAKGKVASAGVYSGTATPAYPSTTNEWYFLCNPRLTDWLMDGNFVKSAGTDDILIPADEPNVRWERCADGFWKKYVDGEYKDWGKPTIKPLQCFWLYRGSGKAPVRN